MFSNEGLRCGNCFHNNHCDFDKDLIKERCGHVGGYYSDYQVCDCVHFIAMDNLAYLEWECSKRNV